MKKIFLTLALIFSLSACAVTHTPVMHTIELKDRLARNVQDLLKLIDIILQKGASITFHKENMTFNNNKQTDAFQKLMLTMLGAISEFERAIILERQKEGIAIAKAKGKYKGGKKKLSDQQIQEIKAVVNDRKTNISTLAKKYNITRQTIYNLIK